MISNLEKLLIWWDRVSDFYTLSYDDRKSYFENIYNLSKSKFLKSKENITWTNYDDFLSYIALYHWTLVKERDLASLFDYDKDKLVLLLDFLQREWFIIILNNFFDSKNLSFKIYFLDNWFRNFIISNFLNISLRHDDWQLYESFVISKFIKNWVLYENMYYWINKMQKEVDLVITNWKKLFAYEIKLKKNIKESDLYTLQYFWKKYKAELAVINENLKWNNFWVNFIKSDDF